MRLNELATSVSSSRPRTSTRALKSPVATSSVAANKIVLAQRLGTVLPGLSPDESVETTRVYSAVGRLPKGHAPHIGDAVAYVVTSAVEREK